MRTPTKLREDALQCRANAIVLWNKSKKFHREAEYLPIWSEAYKLESAARRLERKAQLIESKLSA